MLKIGSFSRIVLVCMGVSYGYLVLSRLMTCVSRGGNAYVESGACRLRLTLIYLICEVSAHLYLMEPVGDHLIVFVVAFHTSHLLLDLSRSMM